MKGSNAVIVTVTDAPGMLYALARVFAERGANVTSVDMHRDNAQSDVYFEFTASEPAASAVLQDLATIPGVESVTATTSLSMIYGKRVIVMGGGAQVGQVALGAVAEADRHNIRGERISVDTIPLVGEREIASAVRALVRLPRVKLLVLAGALMGGEITKAVQDVRARGLFVISLNMAGSVPSVADLVVSDPVQAGVMAVMAVADTARFDLMRQHGRRY